MGFNEVAIICSGKVISAMLQACLWRRGDRATSIAFTQGTDVREIPPKDMPVSVIVPARNEAGTIARVIGSMAAMTAVDEVVVVDNGSSDDTAAVARDAGARVVAEAQPGMGHAIRAGFIAARNDWVMKVDADLDRFDISRFSRMIEARAPGTGLIKGLWQDPRDPMPMTRYLVMPALRQMFPGLEGLQAPNSGLYIFDRSLIALSEITGGYAADLDVMLRVHAAGAGVSEVDIGRIDNNPRDAGHYSAMTETIMGFFLRQRDLRITREIVVLANGAEQVAGGCLGTIAGHARAGGRVNLFLDRAEAEAVQILRAALQTYPTVRIETLDGAISFRPVSTASGVLVIAPQQALEVESALRSALDVLAGNAEIDVQTLLLMPDDAAKEPLEADEGFDIARGLQIKVDALQEMGLPFSGTSQREGFAVRPL